MGMGFTGYMAIYTFRGDPELLLQLFDNMGETVQQRGMSAGKKSGGLGLYVGYSAEGMTVVHIHETEEQERAWANNHEFLEVLREHGIDNLDDVREGLLLHFYTTELAGQGG